MHNINSVSNATIDLLYDALAMIIVTFNVRQYMRVVPVLQLSDIDHHVNFIGPRIYELFLAE